MNNNIPTKQILDVIQNRNHSPLDFIRSISISGDNKVYTNEISKFLGTDEDLSFEIDNKFIVLMRKLNWDSNFFKFNICKIIDIIQIKEEIKFQVDEAQKIGSAILKELKLHKVRYCIWQINPKNIMMNEIARFIGFGLIETRIYYYLNLADFKQQARYDTRLANINDIQTLADTAVKMINPFDRFHADYYISKEMADKMMAKWVEASIKENFADATIVPNSNNPKAFCTVKYHKENWDLWCRNISQPVFSAVGPEFKGWYKKLISELNLLMINEGSQFSYLITQVTNKAVIWTWESLGYKFGKVENVFRLIIY
ncbi:MAG: hypothetical protein STSR0008_13950 [Ignavibacterium sp.]